MKTAAAILTLVFVSGCIGDAPSQGPDSETGGAGGGDVSGTPPATPEAPQDDGTPGEPTSPPAPPPKRLNQSVHLIVNGPRQPPGSGSATTVYGENCFELDAKAKATVLTANFTLTWSGTPTAQTLELRLNNMGAKGGDVMKSGVSPLALTIKDVTIDPEKDAFVIVQAGDAMSAPPSQATDLKLDFQYYSDANISLGKVYGCFDTTTRRAS